MAVLQQTAGMFRGSARVSRPLVVLCIALALAVGWLASQGHDRTTFVVAVAIPLVILLFRYPWTAVLVFVGLMPLFAVGDGQAGPKRG